MVSLCCIHRSDDPAAAVTIKDAENYYAYAMVQQLLDILHLCTVRTAGIPSRSMTGQLSINRCISA